MNKFRFTLLALSVLFAIFSANEQRTESKRLLSFETKDHVIHLDSLVLDVSGDTFCYSSWKDNKSLQRIHYNIKAGEIVCSSKTMLHLCYETENM